MPRLWAMNRYWHQPPSRSRTATPSWTDRVIRVVGARSTKPPHALFDKFMQDNRLRQNPSGRPEKVATVCIGRVYGETAVILACAPRPATNAWVKWNGSVR